LVPKVTEEYKEEKRSLILEGALHCFSEKGYQATTINDIVKYLNLSKGAIYTYFCSKEEIFIQLMEEQTQISYADFAQKFASLSSATAKLRYLFHYFRNSSFEFQRKLGKVYFEFWLYSTRKQELQSTMERRYEHALSIVHAVIAEGKKSGEFRQEVDERNFSRIFWALRDGIALHFTVVGDEETQYHVWQSTEEMVLYYLTAPKEQRS
jgi:AcrR family transcriptional regulator